MDREDGPINVFQESQCSIYNIWQLRIIDGWLHRTVLNLGFYVDLSVIPSPPGLNLCDGKENSVSFGLNIWGLVFLWKLSGIPRRSCFLCSWEHGLPVNSPGRSATICWQMACSDQPRTCKKSISPSLKWVTVNFDLIYWFIDLRTLGLRRSGLGGPSASQPLLMPESRNIGVGWCSVSRWGAYPPLLGDAGSWNWKTAMLCA